MSKPLRILMPVLSILLLLVVLPGGGPLWTDAQAANHREAPLTALDHPADITDFFAFVSFDDPSKVTFILCVDPFLEPSNGPNYFPFDDDIRYEILVDNNHDAKEDVVFQFSFRTEIRLPGVFTGFVGAGDGVGAPANAPKDLNGNVPAAGTPVVPPAITSLDGEGSTGLSLRQLYSVAVIRGGRGESLTGGRTLVAVPSNVGPRTMPDYEDLARQGIYDLGDGIKVFAGTIDDPFWIDLGAAFDTFNFRPSAFPSGVPGVLTAEQDGDDGTNFAADDVSGFNVNAIAIEVPISLLTSTGTQLPSTDPNAVIGTWGTTSRSRIVIRPRNPQFFFPFFSFGGGFVQTQRMANPLINELVIGTGDKDLFSKSHPANDAQFANYFLDPVLARVFNAVYGIPVPDAPRTDLLPLVTYAPPLAPSGTPPGPVADLLRLNTGVPPTAVGSQNRLGLIGGDGAGFPNGRRPLDDVTDIAARAVAGVLAGAPFNSFPHANIGDGVNRNDRDYLDEFPYIAFANDGRDSRHVDPGEPEETDPDAPGSLPVD